MNELAFSAANETEFELIKRMVDESIGNGLFVNKKILFKKEKKILMEMGKNGKNNFVPRTHIPVTNLGFKMKLTDSRY